VKDDPLRELFDGINSLWKHGVIVWGRVIRANVRLYRPGNDDCPGTVIFSATAPDDVTIGKLHDLGRRFNTLQDAQAQSPSWGQRENEWWEDLQNDMSYHRGFDLPSEWQLGVTDYKGSSLMFHKGPLHGGYIQSRILPLLVDPVSSLALVVPFKYWPEGMAEWLATEFPVELPTDTVLSSPWAAIDSLVDQPVGNEAKARSRESLDPSSRRCTKSFPVRTTLMFIPFNGVLLMMNTAG
jgi:hypothetical protein